MQEDDGQEVHNGKRNTSLPRIFLVGSMNPHSTEVDINLVFAEIPPGCFSPEPKQAGSRTFQRFLALLALRCRGRILLLAAAHDSVLSF